MKLSLVALVIVGIIVFFANAPYHLDKRVHEARLAHTDEPAQGSARTDTDPSKIAQNMKGAFGGTTGGPTTSGMPNEGKLAPKAVGTQNDVSSKAVIPKFRPTAPKPTDSDVISLRGSKLNGG